MQIEIRNPFALLAFSLVLATASPSFAQPWQTILPNHDYPSGNLGDGSNGGGRSLAFSASTSLEAPLSLYLGTVDYFNNATITRLIPDAENFPLDPTPEGVDGEPLGGLAFAAQQIQIPGHGIWAVGRYTYRTQSSTTYFWRVRNSLTGDFGDWTTVDDFTSGRLSTRAAGEANARGIAASDSHVFVSGTANDGSGWRWVVRRKNLQSPEGFATVLDVPTGSAAIRPRICVFPGNAFFPPAILTVGKTANIKIGKSTVSYWAVRRSLDGGATFSEEHRWIPASGLQAMPMDIACDPSTGYIYTIGGFGGPLLPVDGGWVIRVNKHGGDPSKWETLLENTSGRGSAHRIAFHSSGTVFVQGHLNPTGSNPMMSVISNSTGESWTDSYSNPSFPFGSFKCMANGGDMGLGPDGKLYVTGDVFDYNNGTELFPGHWLSLARLNP